MPRILLSSVAVIVLFPGLATAQQLSINTPPHDSIIVEEQAEVGGSAPPGNVKLYVGSLEYAAEVADGKWKVKGVQFRTGPNVVRVTQGDERTSVMITRGGNLIQRPRQKVWFSWDSAVDGQLEKIVGARLVLN